MDTSASSSAGLVKAYSDLGVPNIEALSQQLNQELARSQSLLSSSVVGSSRNLPMTSVHTAVPQNPPSHPSHATASSRPEPPVSPPTKVPSSPLPPPPPPQPSEGQVGQITAGLVQSPPTGYAGDQQWSRRASQGGSAPDRALDVGTLEQISAMIGNEAAAAPLEGTQGRLPAQAPPPLPPQPPPPDASYPTRTTAGYCGGSDLRTAEDIEVLQSKAESIVARLDEAEELKAKNPFQGASFEDLLRRIALDQDIKVYSRKVPGDRMVQGTVAEQILAVVDCETERHMKRIRELKDDYENRIEQQEREHREEMERLRQSLIKERMEAEQDYEERLLKSRQSHKEHAEQLTREGMQNQLESEKAKDELALVSEDVNALKKLLYYWKKKNTVLKQAFDTTEQELLLAREKLRDFEQIHQMDAYKVHRFCGQLREKEMQARWRADELEKHNSELRQEVVQLRQDMGQPFLSRSSSEDERLEVGYDRLFGSPGGAHEKAEPEDEDAYKKLRDEADRLRFELSERCKTILGLADRDERVASPSCARAGERLMVAFAKDKSVAAEVQALRDGIRLRDDHIDVILSALRYRDTVVEELREKVEGQAQRIYDLETRVFEPFHCEDLVHEKESLNRQLMDAKEIIYSMQKQLQAERTEIAQERTARADNELKEAKERRQQEIAMKERICDKETEVIRLRNRLQQGGEAEDAATALKMVKLEQEKASLEDQVSSLQDERLRLKHYVATLSTRLEQTLSQLEQRNTTIKQYQALTTSAAIAVKHGGSNYGSPERSAISSSPQPPIPFHPSPWHQ